MHRIDRIGHTELGLEQGLDLLGVAQVGLAGDNVLGIFGSFGLNNVGEDEVYVGRLGVRQELRGELAQSARCRYPVFHDQRRG